MKTLFCLLSLFLVNKLNAQNIFKPIVLAVGETHNTTRGVVITQSGDSLIGENRIYDDPRMAVGDESEFFRTNKFMKVKLSTGNYYVLISIDVFEPDAYYSVIDSAEYYKIITAIAKQDTTKQCVEILRCGFIENAQDMIVFPKKFADLFTYVDEAIVQPTIRKSPCMQFQLVKKKSKIYYTMLYPFKYKMPRNYYNNKMFYLNTAAELKGYFIN